MYRKNLTPIAILFFALSTLGCKSKSSTSDGFPTGQETPEGVAADFARAFIEKDVPLLQKICVRPYSTGASRDEYLRFTAGMAAALKHEKSSGLADPKNPVKILKVFAARHLSKSGPASYGYSSFEFQDLMFVDVEALLPDGSHYMDRELVIKDHDGKWYVHPAPYVSPLLADGLDQESPSKQTFPEAHGAGK